MRKNIKRIIEEYTSFQDGELAISGGPFGFGNIDQLVVKSLNPATRKIADQTDAEQNENLRDLQWNLGRYSTPLQRDDKLGTPDFDEAIPSPAERTREKTDMLAPDAGGKGNLPTNTIVSPQEFVPTEDPRDTDPYLIDDLTNDMMLKILTKLRDEKNGFVNEAGFVDYSNNLYTYETTLNLNPKDSKETMGHTTVPTATNVPSIGTGAVLLPKAFTPEDEIAKKNNRDPNTGKDKGNNDLYDLNLILKTQDELFNESYLKILIKKLINKELKNIK
jgi:hypothetical protein